MSSTRLLGLFLAAVVVVVACQAGGTGGLSSDECADACAKIAAVDCGDVGSECVSSCVHSTEVASDATCRTELSAYTTCYWASESYACDEQRGTLAPGCDKELAAFEACTSGAGGEGGAGGAAEAVGGAEAIGGAEAAPAAAAGAGGA